MKKLFSKIHLWVSVPFGLIITITCFTGALLMFEEEITALCGENVTAVTPVGEPLSLNVIAEKVDATLPDDVEVKGIVVSKSPDEAYKVNLSKPKKAAVYVNQYTGEVTGGDERLPFFQTIFRLHRWLMDSNPGNGAIFWGKMIVGASTLAFVVILITGLVIWWPRNRKMLKNRLQIVFKKGINRFWYDLHVAGGFYALLLLLAMALTGLNWSFEWYKNGVYSLFGVGENKSVAAVAENRLPKSEKAFSDTQLVCAESCRNCTLPVCVGDKVIVQAEQNRAADWSADAVTAATNVAAPQYIDAGHVSINEIDAVTAATPVDAQSGATAVAGTTPVSAPAQVSEFDSWQAAFENVVARVPQYETVTVSAGSVSVKTSNYGNMRAADKYLFDKSFGEIEAVELYEDSNRESKISGWFYSLHIGAWGGLFTRVLSFLAALIGATLPLTGYYFWIRRLYGKRRNKK